MAGYEDATAANVLEVVREEVRNHGDNVRDIIREEMRRHSDSVRDVVREEVKHSQRRFSIILTCAVVVISLVAAVGVYISYSVHSLTSELVVDTQPYEQQLEMMEKVLKNELRELLKKYEQLQEQFKEHEKRQCSRLEKELKQDKQSLQSELQDLTEFLQFLEEMFRKKTEDFVPRSSSKGLGSHSKGGKEEKTVWEKLSKDFQRIKIPYTVSYIYNSMFGSPEDEEHEKKKRRTKIHKVVANCTGCHACKCAIYGPGLTSATVHHETYVIIELHDANGQPCSSIEDARPQLEFNHYQPNFLVQETPQRNILIIPVTTVVLSPSEFNVSFNASTRGLYSLRVVSNSRHINGSSFNITVYPDPTQLQFPLWNVTGLNNPKGIAIDRHGDMIVSEWELDQVSLLDRFGKRLLSYGVNCAQLHRDDLAKRIFCYFDDDPKERLSNPVGLTVDDNDNLFVVTTDKIMKFNGNGTINNTFGTSRVFSKQPDFVRFFRSPKGIALYNDLVYVCDTYKHRIQVLNANFTLNDTIGFFGDEPEQFFTPFDLDFDDQGNLYVADSGNHRIQVLGTNNQLLYQFNHSWMERGNDKSKEIMFTPTAILVVRPYMYVSDREHNYIGVFSTTNGKFVTSFGSTSHSKHDMCGPYGMTFDQHGYLYITESCNNRVQIF